MFRVGDILSSNINNNKDRWKIIRIYFDYGNKKLIKLKSLNGSFKHSFPLTFVKNEFKVEHARKNSNIKFVKSEV